MTQQEGDIADLPDGRTAVFRGGRWQVQAAAPADDAWRIQPMQSPSDRRAEEAASRSEAAAARAARAEDRRLEMDALTQDRQGNTDEVALKAKFEGLPVVREFPVVRSQFQIIRSMAGNSSPAGDLALVTAYMKMLDPGSVVREQEFGNAANAGGAAERARAAISDLTGNGILTPKQRADFVAQASRIYSVQASQYNEKATEYRTVAEQYGFSPDNIATPVDVDAAVETPEAKDGTRPGEEKTPTRLPNEAGFSRDNPIDLTDRNQAINTRKGDWVRLENGDLTRAASDAYEGAKGERQGQGAYVYTPNAIDAIGAGAMAASEQIPFLDESVAFTTGLATGEGYEAMRERQRALKVIDNQSQRGARVAGGLVGAATTILGPGAMASGRYIAQAPTLASAVGRGAMVGGGTGAVYGAGAAGDGLAARLQGASDGAIVGAMTGGALSGSLRGAQQGVSMLRSDKTDHRAAVSMLRDNGVFLTPGQRMGGLAKSVEDLAMRAPILGPAIRGARERARDSFARGAVRQNLSAIGEDLPDHIPAGGEAVEYAANRIGGEFDRAAAMVPEVAQDDQFRATLQRIAAQKSDLPETVARQFDSILADRLARLEGPVTGEQLRRLESEISTLAARYDGAADGAQQQLGSMLYEVSDELSALMGRANPEAGEILGRAREGWAGYTRTRRASAAATGRPFTPGQLGTASRIEDGSVGKGAVGKGNALMQPYARAGQDVMPDAFGNPGTADAVGLGGLAVGAMTEPVTTSVVAGGLSAAATPYFMMGRKVLERAAANPTREGIQAAEQELSTLARSDPKVIELTQELRRLYQGSAGAAGGNAPERPRLMTGAR